MGAAFQIADDILDITSDTVTLGKPAGSDEKSDKNTYPSIIGVKNSRQEAQEYAMIAKDALSKFTGNDAEFLISLADYVVQRAS